jgi:hypothetical protein
VWIWILNLNCEFELWKRDGEKEESDVSQMNVINGRCCYLSSRVC